MSRMVQNFITKYGENGLDRICLLFYTRVSNQKIAKEFGVTRQRVHQWQKHFISVKIEFSESVKEYISSFHVEDS